MSDEIHMESAFRHRDVTMRVQWHGVGPDEALMAAEEWTGDAKDWSGGEYYWLFEALLCYLFANNSSSTWQGVAVRAAFLIRRCAIWMLADEKTTVELNRLEKEVGKWDCFGVEDFLNLCADEEYSASLAQMLGFMYPQRKNRLYRGTQRVYLLAMHYQPLLVRREDGKDLTYEDLAAIFEPGMGLTTKRERSAARSRWSARFQELVRKPIEKAGGTAQVHKSATARERMASSAKGNQNRRGGDRNRFSPHVEPSHPA